LKVDATGNNTWLDSTIDASGWKVVSGVSYSVGFAGGSVSSTAGSTSTITTILDDLVSKINLNAAYRAVRTGDILTVTLADGSVPTLPLSASTSAAPAVGVATVVQGVANTTAATVDVANWTIVVGARYSVTIGTGGSAKTYTLTAGKDYTRDMVASELVRMVKQGGFYKAALSGTVITFTNLDNSTLTVALAAAADASTGTAVVTAGNSSKLVDGQLTIVSDGDVYLRGGVSAVDAGADISIRSLSMVSIDALVTANESLSIRGGIDDTRIGVWLQELVLDGNRNYVSGGTLDTRPGGRVDIESIDSITVAGVLGQREVTDGDLGGAKVSNIRIESLSGNVNLLRNTNVRDTLTVAGNSVGVLSASNGE